MNLKVLRRETTHAQRLIKCLRACWGWRTRRREIDWNMLKISKFQPLSSVAMFLAPEPNIEKTRAKLAMLWRR